jgi:hypothetical protein
VSCWSRDAARTGQIGPLVHRGGRRARLARRGGWRRFGEGRIQSYEAAIDTRVRRPGRGPLGARTGRGSRLRPIFGSLNFRTTEGRTCPSVCPSIRPHWVVRRGPAGRDNQSELVKRNSTAPTGRTQSLSQGGDTGSNPVGAAKKFQVRGHTALLARSILSILLSVVPLSRWTRRHWNALYSACCCRSESSPKKGGNWLVTSSSDEVQEATELDRPVSFRRRLV